MKRILTAAGLAVVIASPAFAQSTPPRATKPPVISSQVGQGWATPRSPYDVVEDGIYVGTDPDPNVRLELRRDYTHGGGSGGD